MIDYKDIEKKIFSFATNPKLGLDNINELLDILHLKTTSKPIIQVIGTNGKGSTCAFLESLLMHLGLKVGVFTSPHLACFRERIRINQSYITQKEILPISLEVFAAIEKMSNKPSFFEILLAIALQYFKNNTDIIVLEAGLGGRLDATTALKANALGVSSIGLDHQAILGDTLEKITLEKIAAAYKGQKVVSVVQDKKVHEVLLQQEKIIGFELSFAKSCFIQSSLVGEHQYLNAGLAIALIKNLGFSLSDSDIKKAFDKTYWPARFETFVYKNNQIIIDGAHNPHAIEVISKHLSSQYENQRWQMIFACLKGHDAYEMANIFKRNHPNLKRIYLSKLNNPRALSYDELKAAFIKAGFHESMIFLFADLEQVTNNHDYDFTLVCGSLYLAGELRQKIVHMDTDEYISDY